MSHLRFCLFAFLVLGVVAGFASQDVSNDICDHEAEPGSECVKLGRLESLMKETKSELESLGNDLKAKAECLKKFVEKGLKLKKEIIEDIMEKKIEAWKEFVEMAADKKNALKNIWEDIIKQKKESMENILEIKKKAIEKTLEKSLGAKDAMKSFLKHFTKDMKKNLENMMKIKKEQMEKLMEGVKGKKHEIEKVLDQFMKEQKEDLEKMFETKKESLEDALKDKKELFDNMVESWKKNANDAKDHILGNKWNKVFGKKLTGPKQVSCNSKILNRFKESIQLILPGTKWCGDGDKAVDDSDLGMLKELDKCCRAHDKCPSNIEAGKVMGNLKNDGLFTKSACSCDFEFYDCLKKAECPIANQIGLTYFDILRPQCFQCKCPKDDCNKENDKDCLNSCKKYEWVDNANYW